MYLSSLLSKQARSTRKCSKWGPPALPVLPAADSSPSALAGGAPVHDSAVQIAAGPAPGPALQSAPPTAKLGACCLGKNQ